ncbi:MAG: ABC transporter substrate-binding protein [Thermomicrobiales bacterium]|nr:ABC transporter substrate-binding protein [Thermomicrobiales bacterium]
MSKPFSLSRRGFVGSAVAGGAAASVARFGWAQDATPGASPEFVASKVAERASGKIRFSSFDDAAAQERVNELLAMFSERYPNIEVSFEPIAADYLTKIQTDIAADNAADVFYVQNEYAQDFMSRDVLLAIDDYMAEDGVSADEYFAPLINAYTWQGKLYGLPKDWSPLGAVYDPDVFSAAGVTEFPTDWDGLRTALQAIKDSTGSVGLAIDPNFDRFIAFLFQAGGNILNEDATEVILDSDATSQALDFMYGLYSDGLISPSADLGAGWPGDAYAQGLAPMVFEGNWMFPFLDLNAPDKAYAVAELPAGPAGKGTPAFTNSYSIFAGSQNPDAAWVFVNYMTSYEAALKHNASGLAIPARVDLEEDYLNNFPLRAPYLASGAYATAVQYGPGGQKFAGNASAALQSLWAGQIDVAECKQQMVDAANSDINIGG